MITVFDVETTDLLKPDGNDLFNQPHIIQFYGIQVDPEQGYQKVNDFLTYVKAPVKSAENAFRAHQIPESRLSGAPEFIDIWKNIADVFFESHTVVAHNLNFDLTVLIYELMRIKKEFQFPYPPIRFCTVEQSMHLKGYRLTNAELYREATGMELTGAHDAKIDVMATLESYKWLIGAQNE